MGAFALRSAARRMRWLVAAAIAAAVGTAAWVLIQGDGPRAALEPGAESAATEAEGETPASHAALEGRQPLAVPPPAKVGGLVLKGKVVRMKDGTGAPMAGVPVEAVANPEIQTARLATPWRTSKNLEAPEPWPPPAAKATSDAEGAFRLEGLDPKSGYTVRARPEAPLVGTSSHVYPSRPATADLRLEVSEGSALKGRVVDGAGRGVRAWVTVTSTGSTSTGRRGQAQSAWWALPPTETDAEGRFTLDAVPNGSLTFGARAVGRAARTGVVVRAPTTEEVLIRIEEPGGVAVEGRVVDTAGKPIEGARVVATTTGERGPTGAPSSSAMATTGADGAYRVEHLLAGRVRSVTADADGYLASAGVLAGMDAPEGGTLRGDIQLARGAVMTGFVRGPKGEAVPGATVVVTYWRRNPFTKVSGEADATGRYRVEGLALGLGNYDVEAEGLYLPVPEGSTAFPGMSPLTVSASDEGQVIEKDLALLAGVPVVGRVADDAGRGVPFATVTATGTPTQRRQGTSRGTLTATSGEDGAFSFAGLEPAADWSFTAKTETLTSEPVKTSIADLGAGPPPRVEIVVHAAASIAGRVVDSKEVPVLGATVVLDEGRVAATRTDERGAFAFRGLAAGTHTVGLQRRDPSTAPTRESRALEWGQEVVDVVLKAPDALTLEGVVVSEKGEALPGLTVIVRSKESNWWSEGVTTDAEGAFRVALVPPGECGVRLGDSQEEQTVEAGARNVRLVWKPASPKAVEGTVLDPDGSPVPSGNLTVTVRAQESSMGFGGQISGGRFRVDLATAASAEGGTADLQVHDARDAAGRPLNVLPYSRTGVAVSGGPVEIRLERALAVAGRVVDEAGQGVEGVTLIGVKQGEIGAWRDPYDQRGVPSGTDGRFRLVGLPAGETWIVATVSGEWAPPAPVRAVAGSDDVVVRLDRGGVVAGRVVDPSDKPVGGATVMASWNPPSAQGAPGGRGGQRLNRMATTRPDGTFRVTGVGTERVQVVVTSPRGWQDSTWRFLPFTREGVAPGTTDLVIRMVEGVRIQGTVVDADGAPVGQAQLQVNSVGPTQGPRMNTWGMSEAGGTFSIGPMQPGRYSINAHGPDGAAGPAVEVSAPATDVRVSLGRALAVSGKVLGQKVGGFTVNFLRRMEGGGRSSNGSGTDDGGRFRIVVQSDDEGSLFVSRQGDPRYGWLDRVRSSGSPYTVTLEQGLSIEGRIEGFTGGGAQVHAQDDSRGVNANATVQPNGSFVVQGLPPGTYRLNAWNQSGSVPPKEGVVAGSRDVVLTVTTK